MPRFEPFRALRYDLDRVDIGAVAAPPYDVISPAQRAVLAQNDRNAVRIDLPVDEGGEDRYAVARRLLAEWQDDGTLVLDDADTFTVYRMVFTDEAGKVRQTTGVIGALELFRPDAGEILPHEQTTPKAKSDRLDMLRYCRANLSAIWGLSLAHGLTASLPTSSPPDAEWTDTDGVTHQFWLSRDPAVNDDIAARIGGQPIVIADGHHRYETSLAYRDERRASGGSGTPADATMCLVVELVADELTVQPIHRLISGLDSGLDVVSALADRFDATPVDAFGPDAVDVLVRSQALGLYDGHRCWLLEPVDGAFPDEVDLDTIRVEVALGDLDGAEVVYQHGVANVLAAVDAGEAQVAILVRPATIDQIEAIAHGGERMPPKTTFFAPKPATGVAFRLLD